MPNDQVGDLRCREGGGEDAREEDKTDVGEDDLLGDLWSEDGGSYKLADREEDEANGEGVCHGQRLAGPPRNGKAQLVQTSHGRRHIGHPCGKAPFVVVPRQNAHCFAADNLGLIRGKDAALCRVVEINADFGFFVVGHDHAHIAASGFGHNGVHVFNGY